MRKARISLKQSEHGMVAIMTTMILIMVISLIVLGFAQIARRNQRESLDRQLSTQAFYAAETGVNDVRELIKNAAASSTDVPEKDTCTGTGTGGFYASLDPDVDPDRNVKYTCLLVDPTPKELRYPNVGDTSVVTPIRSASGDPIDKITFSWRSLSSSSTPTSGCPNTSQNKFSLASSWSCGYGVLRFDLVPTNGVNSIGIADSLHQKTMTTFVVPLTSGGSASIPFAASTANTNNLIGGTCTNTSCDLDIDLAAGGSSENSYYLRVSSMYKGVDLRISAHDSSNVLMELRDAQAVVDSTGKAQDVLRRIRVNLPILSNSENQTSDYAIQTTDAICKRFSTMDGYFLNDLTSVMGANRLCKP